MAGTYNADVPTIKVDGNGREPRLKPDPDSIGASPAAQDDDIYEDAGDLEFSQDPSTIYLTRLPKFLWEKWSKLDDNDEIQIGTVRIEGATSDIKRMSVMLSPGVEENRDIPKEYNMHITDPTAVNTFVFTEKDLPGYKKYSHDRAPPRSSRGRIDKYRKTDQTNFRKAIPKQTNLTGHVRMEVNCLPVENQEHQRYIERSVKEVENTKRKLAVFDTPNDIPGGTYLLPGNLASAVVSNFTTSDVPSKAKRQENKFVRMPQNELLDLIYDCFTRYRYYTLSAMNERLRQPQSYLKETLEKVARLVKGGPHNLQYELRPDAQVGQYAHALDNSKDEAAPAPEFGLDGVDEFDDEIDDDVKMEDVL